MLQGKRASTMRAPALVAFVDRWAGVEGVAVQRRAVPPGLGGAREDAALRSAPCAAWFLGFPPANPGPVPGLAAADPQASTRAPGYPISPDSRKEKYGLAASASPRITWSATGMPRISPARTSRRVVSRSSGDGEQSPLG